MLSTRIITSLAALLAGTAFAQNATNSSVIRIEVGNGGLVFNPSSVTAAPGTKIEFDFYPMVPLLPILILSYPILYTHPVGHRPLTGRNITAMQNHSVVQGDFNSPCHPSNPTIYSGFIPSRSGPAVSPNTRDPAERTTKAAKLTSPSLPHQTEHLFRPNHQRHQAHLVLLRASQALPGRHGRCHQPVTSPLPFSSTKAKKPPY